jgi:hypothetical protein
MSAWRFRNKPLLTLFVGIAISTASAQAMDPGQRSQPLRIERGGLLQVEPTYFDMAAQTGGDFYFWAPGEFARAGVQIPLSGEHVLMAYGKLDAPRRSFEVPVESGVRTLSIFSGAQRKDRAVIVRPGGAVLADGAPGVKLQTFSHMTIATIDSPTPGNWRIDFEGAGLYSISANVRAKPESDAVQLVEFKFVEMGGRLAHEGLFPIRRDLAKGESILCQLWISGTMNPVQVSFVTGDNKPIGVVPMDAEPGDPGHYLGRCVIPNQPFRVVVSGRDRMGQAFRRTQSPLRTPR